MVIDNVVHKSQDDASEMSVKDIQKGLAITDHDG